MLNFNNIRLIAPYKVSGIKSTGLWELEDFLKRNTIICVDCETTGLDVFTNSIVMLQVGNASKQFIIDTRFIDVKYLGQLLNQKKIVGHNLKFDFKQFKYHYNWRLNKLYDTMLVEKILNNNKKEETHSGFYTLAATASRWIKTEFSPSELVSNQKGKKKVILEQGSLFPEFTFSKSIRDEFSNIKNTPFTITQIAYGANDVWMPILIKRCQNKQVRKDNLKATVDLENRFLPVIAEIELSGIRLNEDKWVENFENYQQKEIEALEVLKQVRDINWNSSKQVAKVFKELGIPIEIIDKTKSYGDHKVYKDSVQESHIVKYKDKWDIINPYLEYKGYQKLVSSYGEKFLRHIHPVTNRVHSDFMQIITTGRISSNSPNLQQIPSIGKAPGFRECFVPDKDKIFVISDYSSQESRIIADVSKDASMIEFFNKKGGDFHSFTASKMFKVPVSKDQNYHLRHRGKILNFMIPYGGGAFKLSENYLMPLSEAEEFIKKYYEAFPALESYFKFRHKDALSKGYIVVDRFSKRRVYLKEYEEFINLDKFIKRNKDTGNVPKKIWSKYYTLKGSFERDSQNFPIQGSGANMTKLAACLFYEWAIKYNLDAKIVILVHDEIVVECSKEISSRVMKQLKFFMEEAGNHVLTNKLVKIIASPIKSEFWNH